MHLSSYRPTPTPSIRELVLHALNINTPSWVSGIHPKDSTGDSVNLDVTFRSGSTITVIVEKVSRATKDAIRIARHAAHKLIVKVNSTKLQAIRDKLWTVIRAFAMKNSLLATKQIAPMNTSDGHTSGYGGPSHHPKRPKHKGYINNSRGWRMTPALSMR